MARVDIRACRCSKAPSRWRCPSWPARSRRPSSAARRRSRDRRHRPHDRREPADRVAGDDGRAARRSSTPRCGAKANRDKHVALIFYNYPPGKANIGASYLNVAESLANILQRLAAGRLRPRQRRPVGGSGARRHHRPRRATSAATRRASSRRCSRRAARSGSAAGRVHALARRLRAGAAARRS